MQGDPAAGGAAPRAQVFERGPGGERLLSAATTQTNRGTVGMCDVSQSGSLQS
jgi:hypothetical protein